MWFINLNWFIRVLLDSNTAYFGREPAPTGSKRLMVIIIIIIKLFLSNYMAVACDGAGRTC